jgi:hypothetical protein
MRVYDLTRGWALKTVNTVLKYIISKMSLHFRLDHRAQMALMLDQIPKELRSIQSPPAHDPRLESIQFGSFAPLKEVVMPMGFTAGQISMGTT